MFADDLLADAAQVLASLRVRGLRVTTAESCTGGLVAAVLTEIAGASDVFEVGYVTYSNAAKVALLGVSDEMLAREGAVSQAVAIAMAEGALLRSGADVALSVTGLAGPGGGTAEKPVGLVHMAVTVREAKSLHQAFRFKEGARSAIRMAAVGAGLGLMREALLATAPAAGDGGAQSGV